jgi:prepilin-type N-terminal cleavage/methylation domain-containing protein
MKPQLPFRTTPSQRSKVAFTLLELLVVMTIIGIIAGLLVGLAPVASLRMKETRVRGELQQLVTLIDSYKARYGIYPPDGMYYDEQNQIQGKPYLNPLFYELSGVLAYVPTNGGEGYYYSPHHNETLDKASADAIFHRKGVVNAIAVHQTVTAANSGNVVPIDQRARLLTHAFKDSEFSHYQSKTSGQTREADLLLVGVSWPASDRSNPLAPQYPTLNPWRYVSTNPTNNPDSYDLWAEILVGGRRRIIGNWKTSQ